MFSLCLCTACTQWVALPRRCPVIFNHAMGGQPGIVAVPMMSSLWARAVLHQDMFLKPMEQFCLLYHKGTHRDNRSVNRLLCDYCVIIVWWLCDYFVFYIDRQKTRTLKYIPVSFVVEIESSNEHFANPPQKYLEPRRRGMRNGVKQMFLICYSIPQITMSPSCNVYLHQPPLTSVKPRLY